MRPYFFHTSLYDLASMATLFCGPMLALLLGLAKKASQTANLFLSSALVAIVLKTGGFTPFLLPALGPLLYFYVRQLTLQEQRFRRKDMMHLSLLLVSYWMPAWLALISVIIYLFLSHRLIEDFYRKLRPVLMDRPRFAFRRLDSALLLLGVSCVLSLFNDTFYLCIAFVLIGMAVEAILKPGNDIQLAMPITDRSDAREKSRRLKEAIAANRLYEDAELTLATLSVKLAIHPHDLSRIINIGLDKNFSDFINEFRVREIARKMQDPAYDKLTLLGIAYESGFNSQRTFNRVFKEMTGKTPVEYKNSLKKELPIDKLATPSRIQPVILRSESPSNWAPVTLKRNIMIRNYLKIAYRQLRKQKMYAAVKIGGFALGIAACLLIALYIRDEMSYDKSYPDGERIYRVVGYFAHDGKVEKSVSWPAPMSKAITADFPEVEFAGRMMSNSLIGHAGADELRPVNQVQNTYEQGFIYADQQMLDILKLPMVDGKRENALKEPYTMVISKSKADKYFPGQNPVGQVMVLDNDKAHPYRITAVMADIPSNSHLHPYDFFLTLSHMEFWNGEQNNWGDINYPVYVKLKVGANVARFEKNMSHDIIYNYFLPSMQKGGQVDAQKLVSEFSILCSR